MNPTTNSLPQVGRWEGRFWPHDFDLSSHASFLVRLLVAEIFSLSMKTTWPHTCQFWLVLSEHYWWRGSPLRGNKSQKLAIFGVSPTENPQRWADQGQIWQGIVDLRRKTKKSHFNTGGSFLLVTERISDNRLTWSVTRMWMPDGPWR